MQYISTRGGAPHLRFEEAMLTGLARDGGLYVPQEIPQMTMGDIKALSELSYEEVAFRVMRLFIGDTFGDEVFFDIINAASLHISWPLRVSAHQRHHDLPDFLA